MNILQTAKKIDFETQQGLNDNCNFQKLKIE